MRKQRGFTLVELLVAAAILGILATIGLVSFQAAGRKSRDGKRQADMSQVRAALELYKAQQNTYPVYGGQTQTSYNSMTGALQTAGYLSPPIPNDPKNVSPNVYTYNGSANQFCICSRLEIVGSGNSSGSCGGTVGDYYCVTQP